MQLHDGENYLCPLLPHSRTDFIDAEFGRALLYNTHA